MTTGLEDVGAEADHWVSVTVTVTVSAAKARLAPSDRTGKEDNIIRCHKNTKKNTDNPTSRYLCILTSPLHLHFNC